MHKWGSNPNSNFCYDEVDFQSVMNASFHTVLTVRKYRVQAVRESVYQIDVYRKCIYCDTGLSSQDNTQKSNTMGKA